MLLATLSARVTVTTTAGAQQSTSIKVVSDPLLDLVVDVDVDEPAANLLLPSLQARPGGGPTVPATEIATPAMAVEYLIDGEVPDVALLSPVTVEADLDQCSRSCELVFQVSTGSRRQGDYAILAQGTELMHSAPPPGKEVPQDVRLKLFGLAPDTAISGTSVTYNLITTCYSTDYDRRYSAAAHELRVRANCEEPWRTREIDVELAAGHGLTHGQVVRLAMLAGGVPEERIGVDEGLGSPRYVRVETGCVRMWDFIHEVLEPLGYVVMTNKFTGVFEAVSFDVSETPFVTLRYEDLEISSGMSSTGTTQVASCVKVEGQRRDDGARQPDEGRITTEATVSIFDKNFVLPLAVASQDPGSGAINPTGVVPPGPARTLVSRTRVRSTTLNGCPERNETTTEQWFNPQKARYFASGTTDGEPRLYASGFFFETVPSTDDTQAMFAWSAPRFVITDRQVELPIFDAAGQRTTTVTQQHGWFNPEAPIKTRGTVASTWESQNYVTGRYLDADGTGRHLTREHFFAGPKVPQTSFPPGASTRPELPQGKYGNIVLQALQIETVENQIDDCAQIVSRTKTTRAIEIKNGSQALYVSVGDGAGPNAQGLDAIERETYLVENDDSISRLTTGLDVQGKPTKIKLESGVSRGFQAAEICTPESLREEGTQAFEVRVCINRFDGADLIEDQTRTETLSSIWVETEAEAQAWAERWLRFELGPSVSLALASPLPALDVGKTVRLEIPEFLYDDDPPSPSMDGVLWNHRTVITGGDDDHSGLDFLEIRIPLPKSS